MIVKPIVIVGTNCRLLDLVAISSVLFLTVVVELTFGVYEVALEDFSVFTL